MQSYQEYGRRGSGAEITTTYRTGHIQSSSHLPKTFTETPLPWLRYVGFMAFNDIAQPGLT